VEESHGGVESAMIKLEGTTAVSSSPARQTHQLFRGRSGVLVRGDSSLQ
jgi:hypothetical protein